VSDDPRLDPRHDARLSELISDAVADVEPGEGLTAIRSRTRPDHDQETPMSSSRNWLYAVGGAIAGTAAVIIAIAVVSQLNDDGNGSTPAAGQSTSQTSEPTVGTSPTTTPSETPSTADPSGTPVESAVPVYYAGDGPSGTVLFREFQPGIGADPVSQAASAAVSGTPLDPDYRTLWPAGTQATASYDGDVITVDLTGTDLHDRPEGMSKRDAGLALEQVIYSVQGAAQERAGVQFLLDGQHSDQVLGQATAEPLSAAPALETLSLMSITSPAEGQVVSGKFLASGVNNGFEATVSYEIRQGDKVVGTGFGMADGWMEDKLFPWELEVDVSKLDPGTYTFVAMNDDPSGGAEGHGPDVDTRTIVVQ
jgi:Immunoglobulin-like domain of bacterial spore germination/Sporulation and spore germination